MSTISVSNEVANELEALARLEKRSVSDLIIDMLNQYREKSIQQEDADQAFLAMAGAFDDDLTDLSTSVRETMDRHFRDKQ